MENVAYIMQERKIRLEQTAIYAALKTGPKSNKELCTATGFHSSKIVNQIKQMKRKGIKIIAKRQKTGTIYTLIPAISGSTL